VTGVPDDASDVPGLGEGLDDDVAGLVVVAAGAVVVGVPVPEPEGAETGVVGVETVVVELPDAGAVVVAEPSAGAAGVGAVVVPSEALVLPVPGEVGALALAGFAEEGDA
jgi:hypothetical protein